MAHASPSPPKKILKFFSQLISKAKNNSQIKKSFSVSLFFNFLIGPIFFMSLISPLSIKVLTLRGRALYYVAFLKSDNKASQ